MRQGPAAPLLRVVVLFFVFGEDVGRKRSPFLGERLRAGPDTGDVGIFTCDARRAVGASFFIFGSASFLFLLTLHSSFFSGALLSRRSRGFCHAISFGWSSSRCRDGRCF